MSAEESFRSKDLEKAFITLSKSDYNKRVIPTLLAATQIGNMYCASLYGSLASLLSNVPSDELVCKCIYLYLIFFLITFTNTIFIIRLENA